MNGVPQPMYSHQNDILSPKVGAGFVNRLDGQSLYLSDPELAETSMPHDGKSNNNYRAYESNNNQQQNMQNFLDNFRAMQMMQQNAGLHNMN